MTLCFNLLSINQQNHGYATSFIKYIMPTILILTVLTVHQNLLWVLLKDIKAKAPSLETVIF